MKLKRRGEPIQAHTSEAACPESCRAENSDIWGSYPNSHNPRIWIWFCFIFTYDSLKATNKITRGLKFVGLHLIWVVFRGSLGGRNKVELGTRRSIKGVETGRHWAPAGGHTQFRALTIPLIPLNSPVKSVWLAHVTDEETEPYSSLYKNKKIGSSLINKSVIPMQISVAQKQCFLSYLGMSPKFSRLPPPPPWWNYLTFWGTCLLAGVALKCKTLKSLRHFQKILISKRLIGILVPKEYGIWHLEWYGLQCVRPKAKYDRDTGNPKSNLSLKGGCS